MSLTLYHGTTSRIAKMVKDSGKVYGWWSTSFNLACHYAGDHVRQDHAKGFNRSKPVILEAEVPKRRMKVHARIAYYPKNQRRHIPRDLVKAAWRWKASRGLNSPCLKRLWRRGRL